MALNGGGGAEMTTHGGRGVNLKKSSFQVSSSNYQVSVEKNTLWST